MLELRNRDEVVLPTLLFRRPLSTGGVGNRELQLGLALQQGFHEGGLAGAGGRRDDEELTWGHAAGILNHVRILRAHNLTLTQFQAIQILADGVAMAFAAGDRGPPASTRMKSPRGVRLTSRTWFMFATHERLIRSIASDCSDLFRLLQSAARQIGLPAYVSRT